MKTAQDTETFYRSTVCYLQLPLPDETNAKKILTASPLENWRRPQDILVLCGYEDYPARSEIQ